MKASIIAILIISLTTIRCGGKAPKTPAPQWTAPEKTIAADVGKIMGRKSGWLPDALAGLKAEMSCDEAARMYRGLKCSEDNPEVKIHGNSAIAGYKFTFVKGKL